MIKLCVSGSKGKMGERIIELSKKDADFELSGSFDAGEDAQSFIEKCDCLIEFTSPEATIANLEICEKLGKAIVIGTTGLSSEQQDRVKAASAKIPVVISPNMSVGVNVLFKMVEDAAKVLGSDYCIEIVEAHHVHKKDKPSGTAKEMARIVKDIKGDVDIPIESVREDEIVGEHTIVFNGGSDLVEMTHSAKSRDIFAEGALTAAKFVTKKKSGIYSMREVLGL